MKVTATAVGRQGYIWEYPPEAESAARVRKDTTLTLYTWGLDGLVDSAKLVACELFSNALRHCAHKEASRPHFPGRSITVRLDWVQDARVRISVHDLCSTRPAVQAQSATREGGRGLFLVDSLAVEWGTTSQRVGKQVWAELALDATETPSVAP
jgi:hypothetical protein